MTKATKIPIRIDWINDENDTGGIEVIMDLGDFELSGSSIRSNISEFKKMYLSTVEQARKIDNKAASGRRNVPTKERWKACKILANFNDKIAHKFEVINYKEAYARDFGLPLRSIRAYLDFGKNFSDSEVLDKIPYSMYAEIVFRINGLKSKNIFEREKKNLIKMGKEGMLPNRDRYRSYLKSLINSSARQP